MISFRWCRITADVGYCSKTYFIKHDGRICIHYENISRKHKKQSFFQNSKLSEIPITISILQASTFEPKINLPKQFEKMTQNLTQNFLKKWPKTALVIALMTSMCEIVKPDPNENNPKKVARHNFSDDVLGEIVHLHGPLYSLFSE